MIEVVLNLLADRNSLLVCLPFPNNLYFTGRVRTAIQSKLKFAQQWKVLEAFHAFCQLFLQTQILLLQFWYYLCALLNSLLKHFTLQLTNVELFQLLAEQIVRFRQFWKPLMQLFKMSIELLFWANHSFNLVIINFEFFSQMVVFNFKQLYHMHIILFNFFDLLLIWIAFAALLANLVLKLIYLWVKQMYLLLLLFDSIKILFFGDGVILFVSW